MTRTSLRIGLIAVIALAAAFCSRTPASETAEPSGETVLVVDNQSTSQATIYVLRDSRRQRLGAVESLRVTRLSIPDMLLRGPTPLRFEVQPLASRAAPISMEILVSPGDEVNLRIPSTIR